MATWSSINYNTILADRRNDAEFYKPEYIYSVANVRKLGSIKLRKLQVEVVSGPFGSTLKSSEYTSSGIPLIRISDLDTFFVNKDEMVYISESANQRIKGSELSKGDLVLSKVGNSIGIVSMLDDEIPKANISENNIGIRFRNDVDPKLKSCLLVYLNSSFGQSEILRRRSGNAQPKLNISDVYQIEVPVFSDEQQKIINNFVLEINGTLKHSKLLYTKAQRLLESELGLDKLSFQKPVGYTARFSEMEQSHRTDAQHYQPRFVQLLSYLTAFSPKRIRDIRICNRRGLQPVYVENGPIDVVNSQHLGPQHIGYDGLQKTSEKAFAASTEGHIQNNDLLIYTTGAYIGRTNVYLRNAPALASNHVNILRLNSGIDAAYMALVFQSIVGQFQTQKHARGSAQAELYPADIDRFIVPLIDSSMQIAIGDLVRNSLEKKQKSKRLLDKAKTRVEKLIEEAVRQ